MLKGEYTDLKFKSSINSKLCYRGEDDKEVEICSNKHGTIGHMSDVNQSCYVQDFKTMITA